MGADGSLILDTGIDTSGLAAGSKEMMRAIQSFGKKASKTIKQTVKSVIATIAGVGSALAVLSKSVSSYLSSHWQTAAKLEACWQAVGEVIGPVIEEVVDLVQKAVSYLIDFLYYVGLSSKTAKQASADAKAAAQAMKRSLMGFDELNLLQRDTTTTLGDYELPEWLQNIAELLKGGYFEEAGRLLAQKLNEMIDNIDWAALGQKISYYWLGALDFLYGFIDEFDWNNLGLKLREMLENIDWEGIIDRTFDIIFGLIEGNLELLWGLLGNDIGEEDIPIVKALKNLRESFKNFKQIVEPILKWMNDIAVPAVFDLLATAIQTLADVIQNSPLASDLGNLWTLVLKPMLTTALTDTFPKILEEIAKGIKEISDSGVGHELVMNLSNLWTGFLSKIIDWAVENALPDCLKAIGEGLKIINEVISIVEPWLELLWDNFLEPLLTISFDGAIDFLTKFRQILQSIGELLSGEISFKEFAIAMGDAVDGTQTLREEAQKTGEYIEWLKESLTYAGEASWLGSDMISSHLASFTSAMNEYKEYITSFASDSEEAQKATEEFGTKIDELASKYRTLAQEVESQVGAEELYKEFQEELSALVSEYNIVLGTEAENTEAITEDIGNAANSATEMSNAVKASADSANKLSEAQEEANLTIEGTDTSTTTAKTGLDNLTTTTEEDMGKNTTAVTDFAVATEESVTDVKSSLGDGSDGMEEFADNVEDSSEDATYSMEDMTYMIEDIMNTLVGEASEWGYDIGMNITRGLRSSSSQVASAANNIAAIIRSYLHFSEPDKGPLKDFHTYMPDMIKGMVNGINDNKGKLIDAVHEMSGDMADELGGDNFSFDSTSGKITNVLNGITQSISSGLQALSNNMSPVIDTVVSAFNSVSGESEAEVEETASNIENTIADSVTAINEGVEEVGSSIKTVSTDSSTAISSVHIDTSEIESASAAIGTLFSQIQALDSITGSSKLANYFEGIKDCENDVYCITTALRDFRGLDSTTESIEKFVTQVKEMENLTPSVEVLYALADALYAVSISAPYGLLPEGVVTQTESNSNSILDTISQVIEVAGGATNVVSNIQNIINNLGGSSVLQDVAGDAVEAATSAGGLSSELDAAGAALGELVGPFAMVTAAIEIFKLGNSAAAAAVEEVKTECDQLAESGSGIEAIGNQFQFLGEKIVEEKNNIMGAIGDTNLRAEIDAIRESLTGTINDYVNSATMAGDTTRLSISSARELEDQINSLITSYENEMTVATSKDEIMSMSIELQEKINQLLAEYGVEIDEQGRIIQNATNEIASAAEETEKLTENVGEGTENADEYSKSNENAASTLEELGTEEGNAQNDVKAYSTEVKTQLQEAEQAFDDYDTTVKEVMSDVQSELTEAATDMQDFADGVEDSADNAANSIEIMASSIEGTVSSLVGQAYGWGSDIGNQIANGLNSASSAVSGAASNIASIISSYLHFSEPDVGPLSDFHTYMPDMIKEMVSGINKNAYQVDTAVKELAQEISDEVTNGDYTFKNVGVELSAGIDGFSNTVVNGFENLIEQLSTIADKVTFQMPEVAVGNVLPYSTSVTGESDSAVLTSLSSTVDELQTMFRRFMDEYSDNANRTPDIQLDGMSLARGLYKYNKRAEQEHGKSLIS